MKKLLKVHISIWILITITIIISIISTILLLNTRVESVLKTAVHFNKDGSVVQMDSRQVYKLRASNKVTFKVNNKFYIGHIDNFKHIKDKDLFNVLIKWDSENLPPIPSGVIDAQIIYDNNKVLHSLFSPSV